MLHRKLPHLCDEITWKGKKTKNENKPVGEPINISLGLKKTAETQNK